MANEWLHRIGAKLDDCIGSSKSNVNIKVYVEFQDHDPPQEPVNKPSYKELLDACLVLEHEERGAAVAVFKAGFLSGFQIAENIAERFFVLNVVRVILKLLEEACIDKTAEEITEEVVWNKQGRSFHMFQAQGYLDYVRDFLPKELVTIDSIDDAAAKIGLGWRVARDGNSNKIDGRKSCTQFLNKIVDVLLSEITDMLATYERITTLERLILNCEKAGAEEDHWKRTSAAVIGLYGNDEDTVARYVETTSKFAGAGIASRALIEIALCVCPLEEERKLSDIELSKLIARIALVVRIGELSNAIHYNALAPEIMISPLGDLLFRDDFGDLVVQPMLSRVLGEKFIDAAPRQTRNYDAPDIIPTIRGKIDNEFWGIWKNEMGFDPDEAREIIGALEDKGVSDRVVTFRITKKEYLDCVCSEAITEEIAISFLNQFSLRTRRRWDHPPKGFHIDDIEPWRFGRRLSFVVRPILQVDNKEDPLLIISPASLRKGFAYFFDGTYSGRLKQSFFKTEAMRNIWFGKAGEGHSFNAEVARQLSEAGWEVRENIGLPEVLNKKLDVDYGDVDVLAWQKERKDILVIECKDLSLARNYSEIAALLSEYQGLEKDGEADSLKKHLNRVSVICAHLDQLKKFTGNQNPKIVSCLVCSGIVPMQFAKIEALSGTHVGSVEDILQL